jgi:hypothetical protein
VAGVAGVAGLAEVAEVAGVAKLDGVSGVVALAGVARLAVVSGLLEVASHSTDNCNTYVLYKYVHCINSAHRLLDGLLNIQSTLSHICCVRLIVSEYVLQRSVPREQLLLRLQFDLCDRDLAPGLCTSEKKIKDKNSISHRFF